MASCEVEPLDLSMDNMHVACEKQFERMNASGDMRKKMEELAKDMSHFTYKDLWIECYRRYKDIMKRILGYEVHSHLVNTEILELINSKELTELEPMNSKERTECRKRKASGGSNDSGWGDDTSLPLKKRLLIRSDYLADSNVLDSKDNPPQAAQIARSHISSSNTMDCFMEVDTEDVPPQCFETCSEQSNEQANCMCQDSPYDLSTHPTLKHRIPELTKYDSVETRIMPQAEERNTRLLTKLLTEPRLTGLLPMRYPLQPPYPATLPSEPVHRSQNLRDQDTPENGQFYQIGTTKPDVYASPYLSTSTDYGQYSQPTRQLLVPMHSKLANFNENYRINNTRRPNDFASIDFSVKDVSSHHAHSISISPQSCASVPMNKPKSRRVRENHKDKVLKRLLLYSLTNDDNNSDDIETKATKSVPCETALVDSDCKTSSRVPKSFWNVIEQACNKMAAF